MERLEGTERFTPKVKPDAKERPEDEVLAEAPVGSRVNFSAFAPAGPFEQTSTTDNTIKMGKDLYAAHDVPKGKSGMYTKEQMREMLAEKYGRSKEMVRVTLVDILELQ
jgi:hypothetical protein